jgi:hypothetical protein
MPKCNQPLGPARLISLQLVQAVTQNKRLMLAQELPKVPVALSRVWRKSLVGCQPASGQSYESFDGVAVIAAAEEVGDYRRLLRRRRVSRRLSQAIGHSGHNRGLPTPHGSKQPPPRLAFCRAQLLDDMTYLSFTADEVCGTLEDHFPEVLKLFWLTTEPMPVRSDLLYATQSEQSIATEWHITRLVLFDANEHLRIRLPSEHGPDEILSIGRLGSLT